MSNETIDGKIYYNMLQLPTGGQVAGTELVEIIQDGENRKTTTNAFKSMTGGSGKSTYEEAVLNGFTGTESQWLASLIGPKGVVGLPGIKGLRGVNGNTGMPGVVGPTGPTGDTGTAGATGLRGVSGEPGIQGFIGNQGPTGPIGITGKQGIQGPQGDKGSVGDVGILGLRGEDGVQGPQGDAGVNGIDGVKGVKGDDGDPGPIGPKGPVTSAGNGVKVLYSKYAKPTYHDGNDGDTYIFIPEKSFYKKIDGNWKFQLSLTQADKAGTIIIAEALTPTSSGFGTNYPVVPFSINGKQKQETFVMFPESVIRVKGTASIAREKKWEVMNYTPETGYTSQKFSRFEYDTWDVDFAVYSNEWGDVNILYNNSKPWYDTTVAGESAAKHGRIVIQTYSGNYVPLREDDGYKNLYLGYFNIGVDWLENYLEPSDSLCVFSANLNYSYANASIFEPGISNIPVSQV